MSTITKERAELKAFITGFLSDPAHDNQSSRSMTAEVFRIALASLEAEDSGRNPVLAYADSYRDMAKQGVEFIPVWSVITDLERNIAPLFTAQPSPVSVPDDVMAAMQKVSRIRLDLNDFDGDKRGILDCLSDAEEALIEVVNRRAAMLQGAENVESPTGNSPVIPDGYALVPVEPTEDMIVEGFESWPDEFFSDTEVWEAFLEMSGCQQSAHLAKLCWAAMIAAAPQQEVKL
ncbi:hypothetical protein ACX928_03245 [Enterobacter roggenkampii]